MGLMVGVALLVQPHAFAEPPQPRPSASFGYIYSHPDTACTMRTRGQEVITDDQGREVRRTWTAWTPFSPAGSLNRDQGDSVGVSANPSFELALTRTRPTTTPPADWTSTVTIRPSPGGQRVSRTTTPATGECAFGGEAALRADESTGASATDTIHGATGTQTKNFRTCFVSEDTSTGDRTRVEVKCVLTHSPDRDADRSLPGGGGTGAGGAGTGS